MVNGKMLKEEQLSDETLCRKSQNGDMLATEQLIIRHSRLVKTCARSYFLIGADSEDLIQEGMIGLLSAINAFDSSKNDTFASFASICITRRIYSAVRAANSYKHQPLNQSVPIEKPLFDDNAEPHKQAIEPIFNPEDMVIGMEEQQELLQSIFSVLSVFEAKVLRLFLQGLSHNEMAQILGKSNKSLENAIQRIRRKSATILYGEDRT